MIGFTIDSIKLFLNWEELYGFDFKILEKELTKVRKKRKYFSNSSQYIVWTEGFYKNFKISFSEVQGIYLSGSISNFYKGYSELLKYSELKQAVEKLGSELGLYLHDAWLYRIDLPVTIQTDKPVEQYSHYLFSDLSRFRRLEQHTGVLFKTVNIEFFIYNKSLQLLDKKGIRIPNALRLELRLMRNVSDFFGIKEMKISDLYDSNTFLKLLYGFQNIYDRIEKLRVPKDYFELQSINPKIQSQWLKLNNAIESYGGVAGMYRLIEQADLEGKFKNPNDKSRCRKDIRELVNNEVITKPHPLALEISDKIRVEIEKSQSELTNTKSTSY